VHTVALFGVQTLCASSVLMCNGVDYSTSTVVPHSVVLTYNSCISSPVTGRDASAEDRQSTGVAAAALVYYSSKWQQQAAQHIVNKCVVSR
jgi:hypothetical protein